MRDARISEENELPVSRALRDAIHDQGLTAYALAKQAGVSVDAVQRFLKEERGLSLATVDKLAVAMRLTLCSEESRDRRRAPGPVARKPCPRVP